MIKARTPAGPRLPSLPISLLAALLVLAVGFAASCGGRPQAPAPPELRDASGQPLLVTVHRSPGCSCCRGYEDYLRDHGLRVESVEHDVMDSVKADFGVPEEMRSCHTAVLGDYFIEGHVPLEAIVKLLEERPAIDGIALPGMPTGSPGMGGDKEGPFIIYSIAEGRADEFMVL